MRTEIDPVELALFSATQLLLILSEKYPFIEYYSSRRNVYPDYSSGKILEDKFGLQNCLTDVKSRAYFDVQNMPPISIPIKIDVICGDVLYLDRNLEDCPKEYRKFIWDIVKIEAANLLYLYNESLRFNLRTDDRQSSFCRTTASKIKVFTGSGFFSMRISKTLPMLAFIKSKLKALSNYRNAAEWDKKYVFKTNRFYDKMIEYV